MLAQLFSVFFFFLNYTQLMKQVLLYALFTSDHLCEKKKKKKKNVKCISFRWDLSIRKQKYRAKLQMRQWSEAWLKGIKTSHPQINFCNFHIIRVFFEARASVRVFKSYNEVNIFMKVIKKLQFFFKRVLNAGSVCAALLKSTLTISQTI